MNNSFRIVSYYTLDTPYQEIAQKYIIPSLQKLDVQWSVPGVKNLGSWGANTSFKATFIKTLLELHKENIVFIDADAEVLEYPRLFEEIPLGYNFAAHILNRKEWYQKGEDRNELLTGTLWVRNCPRSMEIIDEWIEECAKTSAWEQQVLEKILYRNKELIYTLPLSYCYIKTLPNGKEPHIKIENPVIVHNQCSRQYRNKIK